MKFYEEGKALLIKTRSAIDYNTVHKDFKIG
ncbi:hypothetical protein BXY64_3545 [Marinifilum flexuosum]|uniref:Uncharacterized protein n=1 Tax=Marinifilum flexuosum TaxID=1117708 RepID=A0A419WT72_9BACT|nr:hypothetical protein BXY64_3545 [Marinifilum flexuosum]